jgi:hypothetical protein
MGRIYRIDSPSAAERTTAHQRRFTRLIARKNGDSDKSPRRLQKWRRIVKRTLTVVSLVLLTAASIATADTLSIQLGNSTSITDGVRSRLLVRPALPASIDGARIDFAMLVFPGLQIPDSLDSMTGITIQVRRISTPWNPGGCSWTTPWHTPGGDYDSSGKSQFTLLPVDARPFRIEVTRLVTALQTTGNQGLIFIRPGYEGGGFGGEGALLRHAIKSARLKLWFTHVSP